MTHDARSDNYPVWKEDEDPREPVTRCLTDEQVAAWIADTCRRFGTTVSTAHKVAGHFVEQLEKDRQRDG